MSTILRAGTFSLIGLLTACNGEAPPPIKDDDTGGESTNVRAPWVTIHIPDGGAVVTESSSVTLMGSISDYDSELNTIAATWKSATGAELCGASAPTEPAVEGDPGTVSCTFTVSREDTPVTLVANDGAFESSASIDLVVRTADPPSIDIHAPADGSYINEGETFTLEAEVEDDNDAPNALTVMLESDIDGTIYQGTADPSGEVDIFVNGISLGNHTLTLSATDRDGFTGSTSIAFEVNSKPGSPVVHIDPTNAGTGDDLTVVIDTEAPDADGDSLTYRYTWYADGEIVTGEVSDTLSATRTSRGEEWSVWVAATDGRSVGEPTEASIVIDNTPPELDEAILTPDPATELDDLVCTAGTSTDVDGDAVEYTYTWQVAGVVRPETDHTLPAGIALEGNSVICTIIPTDGTDVGSGVRSNTVVISAVP